MFGPPLQCFKCQNSKICVAKGSTTSKRKRVFIYCCRAHKERLSSSLGAKLDDESGVSFGSPRDHAGAQKKGHHLFSRRRRRLSSSSVFERERKSTSSPSSRILSRRTLSLYPKENRTRDHTTKARARTRVEREREREREGETERVPERRVRTTCWQQHPRRRGHRPRRRRRR